MSSPSPGDIVTQNKQKIATHHHATHHTAHKRSTLYYRSRHSYDTARPRNNTDTSKHTATHPTHVMLIRHRAATQQAHRDTQEHYQRHFSNDNDDNYNNKNHNNNDLYYSSGTDSEDSEDEDAAAEDTARHSSHHTPLRRRHRRHKRWLEFLLHPRHSPRAKNNRFSLFWFEKMYFLCVTLPVLVLLWPIAPIVAAELAHYPLLELLDSKEAVFLPSQYLQSGSSPWTCPAVAQDTSGASPMSFKGRHKWFSGLFSGGLQRGIKNINNNNSSATRATTQPLSPVSGDHNKPYNTDNNNTKNSNNNANKNHDTLSLRHVESSLQMLAERERDRSKLVSQAQLQLQFQQEHGHSTSVNTTLSPPGSTPLSPRGINIGVATSNAATNKPQSSDESTKASNASLFHNLKYFMREDVDRILLPLVRAPLAVDLDALAKKSLAKQSQHVTKKLEHRLNFLEQHLEQLLQQQQQQQEIMQLMVAQLREMKPQVNQQNKENQETTTEENK